MDHSEVKHLPKVDHTPANLDDESKAILAAANLIESEGWVQGDWHSASGGYCMRGAVYRVYGDYDYVAAWPALNRMELGMPSGMSCMGFNDTPGRTKDEVVAKMRAIALGL